MSQDEQIQQLAVNVNQLANAFVTDAARVGLKQSEGAVRFIRSLVAMGAVEALMIERGIDPNSPAGVQLSARFLDAAGVRYKVSTVSGGNK